MKLNDVEVNNVVGDVEMSDNCHLNTVDHVEVVMNTDEAHHHHHHHATEGNPLNELCNVRTNTNYSDCLISISFRIEMLTCCCMIVVESVAILLLIFLYNISFEREFCPQKFF